MTDEQRDKYICQALENMNKSREARAFRVYLPGKEKIVYAEYWVVDTDNNMLKFEVGGGSIVALFNIDNILGYEDFKYQEEKRSNGKPKCKDCRFLSEEHKSIGYLCTKDRPFRSDTAMWKKRTEPSCKHFEPRGGSETE